MSEIHEKIEISSWNKEEVADYVKTAGMPSFRGKQIFDWLHKKMVTSFSEMTNLSEQMRSSLDEKLRIASLEKIDVQISAIDDTRKYLFRLFDGNMIESVLMSYHHGYSVCISSQAGCRMGCRFCASTLNGLARNLTAGEMLSQIYEIQKDIDEKISHVVIMGSGEPLDNFEQVVRFLSLITNPDGFGMSIRNITVSTCGIVPRMYELADMKLGITLAISLHAPNDEIRKQTMPIANTYSMEELLSACQYYFEKTGRRLTFEYSLVQGVNDSKQNAEELAKRLKSMGSGERTITSHVNLIPVNPIKERDFKQTSRKNVLLFQNLLEKNGINATIRREMGRDIDGACGQLRKRFMDEQETEERK